MNIVFFGPPGSGKGTQSTLLAEVLGLPRVVTGDILRAERKSGTPRGQQIAEMIDKGNFVHDEMVLEIVEDELKDPKYDAGVILDGFPRTLKQAQAFSREVDCFIYLVLQDHLCEFRLVTRQVGRADDAPEVVQDRLVVFHRDSEPTEEFYKPLGTVIRIDSSKPVEEVHQDILKAMRG